MVELKSRRNNIKQFKYYKGFYFKLIFFKLQNGNIENGDMQQCDYNGSYEVCEVFQQQQLHDKQYYIQYQ